MYFVKSFVIWGHALPTPPRGASMNHLDVFVSCAKALNILQTLLVNNEKGLKTFSAIWMLTLEPIKALYKLSKRNFKFCILTGSGL